jgi:glucan phosphoethanolaminetransferase (alkaline phosphatase superfamily)
VYALDESIARLAIESMDQMQVEKWTTNVQSFVLYNRICLFVAKRLRLYQDSGLNIVSSIIAILLLVVFTVLSFALVNFGLFKINPHFFSSSIVPTFFNFFYYSFNVLLFNPIQDIVATTPTSQVISMTESFFALFLVAIFVSLVLSVRSQKDANELNDLIKDLNEEGTKMEGYIREKYKFNNVEEAMEALQKLKASFTGFIYKITEGIE